MSREEQERGKGWILERLEQNARDLGVSVEGAEWIVTTEDFKAGLQSLVFQVGQRRLTERFTDADLEDLPADSGVQTTVEHRLVQLLGRASTM